MTDLASQPTRTTQGAPRPERGGRSRWQGTWSRLRGREERTLAGAAALAALGAVVGGLLVLMVLALAGWYLAEAGAYGTTTSALLVAVQVWLLGHGATLSIGGVPFGLVPLAVTLGQAYLLLRLARRAGRTARPGADDRTLLQAGTVLVGVYVVLVTALCVLTGGGPVSAAIPGAVLGSALLAAVVGPLGLAQGTGRLPELLERVPGWARAVVHGAVASCGAVLAAATLLLVVALAFGFNDAMAVLAGLRLGGSDQVAYAAATLLLVPNAVVMAAAYLLGPGFAVGAGTVVSPTAVALGPVPAFPLLAALPDDGPAPAWLVGVLAVPGVAAVLGAARAQRAYGVAARDSAALRGFGAGALAGVLMTVLCWLAGGPVGDGRLAVVGPPVAEVLVLAVGSMSIAGLVSGSVVAWWQRRRARA
ncbi:cell division protein PerM [Nocardioides marmoraquaticus]